jgi:hypothetical protein
MQTSTRHIVAALASSPEERKLRVNTSKKCTPTKSEAASKTAQNTPVEIQLKSILPDIIKYKIEETRYRQTSATPSAKYLERDLIAGLVRNP